MNEAEEEDTCIRTTAGGESVWLMRHLEDLDFHAGGVIPFNMPSLGTHVSCAEQVNRAIALTHEDAAIYAVWRGHGGVNADVEVDEGIAFFLIKVTALRRLAHTVEAVDLHVRGEGQPCLKWVEPCARVVLVRLDFLGCMRDAV